MSIEAVLPYRMLLSPSRGLGGVFQEGGALWDATVVNLGDFQTVTGS